MHNTSIRIQDHTTSAVPHTALQRSYQGSDGSHTLSCVSRGGLGSASHETIASSMVPASALGVTIAAGPEVAIGMAHMSARHVRMIVVIATAAARIVVPASAGGEVTHLGGKGTTWKPTWRDRSDRSWHHGLELPQPLQAKQWRGRPVGLMLADIAFQLQQPVIRLTAQLPLPIPANIEHKHARNYQRASVRWYFASLLCSFAISITSLASATACACAERCWCAVLRTCFMPSITCQGA